MTHDIKGLLDIMSQLRDPESGCPWDLEQCFRTIAPYTIEEAYEVADAIEKNDLGELKNELGDLLFQVVFHSQMAKEAGHFTFEDVVHEISDKMVRRHPHVFGKDEQRSAESQTVAWEEQKAAERSEKGLKSLLDDVPVGLPGLSRAVKLQKRAARVGFDWPRARDVLEKLQEECQELVTAMDAADESAIEDEFGDILFVMANLSRHLKVDPEAALRRTNEKFVQRFGYIEKRLLQGGRTLQEASLEEMESLWQEAKSNG